MTDPETYKNSRDNIWDNNRDNSPIAVLGGGAWGSALASALAARGHETRIWVRRDDHAAALTGGVSPVLDMAIAAPSLATTDAAAVLDGAGMVLAVLPTSATDDTIAMIRAGADPAIPIAWAAKGLVPGGDALIPEHASAHLPNPAVMLSGPSFADEVTAGKPAALVAASQDDAAANAVAMRFYGSNIRVYTSNDPVSVAVGGAVKNVIAIASGIVTGMGLGDNARAALITRGLAETTRFALALGGQRETLFGLAGLGDMVLTCSGAHSRNFAFGLALAEGGDTPAKLAEGKHSAAVILRRAARLKVDMPITEAVARVLIDGADIRAEINRLLQRPVDSEWG